MIPNQEILNLIKSYKYTDSYKYKERYFRLLRRLNTHSTYMKGNAKYIIDSIIKNELREIRMLIKKKEEQERLIMYEE